MNIDDENEVSYDLVDLEDLISNCFANVEENEQVRFSGTFRFDDDLFSISYDNQEIDEENKYHNLVRSFLPTIEAGCSDPFPNLTTSEWVHIISSTIISPTVHFTDK